VRKNVNYESIIKPPASKQLKSGRVRLEAGEHVGEHITTKKEELIIVMKGTAQIIKEGEKIMVSEGKATYIAPETVHDVKNIGNELLEYYYVVTLLD